jgi:hypothetical protein
MSARWYIDRKCEVSIENHCRASTVKMCLMEDREKRIVRSPDQEVIRTIGCVLHLSLNTSHMLRHGRWYRGATRVRLEQINTRDKWNTVVSIEN